MTGKTEVNQDAGAAGESTTMSGLLQQQLEIVDLIDQASDELGVLYGKLVKLQHVIGRRCHRGGAANSPGPVSQPSWIAESWLNERLRNRLAMEFAEHSSGGGNQSIFGEVNSRETLLSVFKKIADPEVWGKGEPA